MGKDLIRTGVIRADPNCFYRLRFRKTKGGNSNQSLIVEHLDMLGTGKYCSQYLFDQLISTTPGTVRSLKNIEENPYFYNFLVSANYRLCYCNQLSKNPDH